MGKSQLQDIVSFFKRYNIWNSYLKNFTTICVTVQNLLELNIFGYWKWFKASHQAMSSSIFLKAICLRVLPFVLFSAFRMYCKLYKGQNINARLVKFLPATRLTSWLCCIVIHPADNSETWRHFFFCHTAVSLETLSLQQCSSPWLGV